MAEIKITAEDLAEVLLEKSCELTTRNRWQQTSEDKKKWDEAAEFLTKIAEALRA